MTALVFANDSSDNNEDENLNTQNEISAETSNSEIDADNEDSNENENSLGAVTSILNPHPAAFAKQVRQSFSDTLNLMLQENELDIYELGQPLSGEFSRAVEAQKRINHCHKFIKSDGNYGDWGLIIESALQTNQSLKNMLLTNAAGDKAGMKLVCPRFKELNNTERIEFWVWTLTTLALYESTCGFDTSNEINSNAVGIFQLHASKTDRLPRSQIYNKQCGRFTSAEISRPQNNIVCTLDFMRDSFSGRFNNMPAGLLTPAQQFQRLRSLRNPIINVLKRLKICQFDPKRLS